MGFSTDKKSTIQASLMEKFSFLHSWTILRQRTTSVETLFPTAASRCRRLWRRRMTSTQATEALTRMTSWIGRVCPRSSTSSSRNDLWNPRLLKNQKTLWNQLLFQFQVTLVNRGPLEIEALQVPLV